MGGVRKNYFILPPFVVVGLLYRFVKWVIERNSLQTSYQKHTSMLIFCC